jgi:mediator of RNA polymerase II transcription subunit 16, fungi type
VDLISWLSDCLFSLMDDPKFMELLSVSRFADLTKYLQERNDVSLHLLLCSSTRGFLSAVCRRLLHLEALSNRAIEFYERRAAIQSAADPNGGNRIPHTLHKSYQNMQHVTSSSLVRVQDFDKLLSNLGADIRAAYQVNLASMASRASAQGGQIPTGKQLDTVIKTAQVHCELQMLLAGPPPPAFLSVILKFFNTDLKGYKLHTDPAELFFADFRLLEVDDDKNSLAERRRSGRYVDVFKRSELFAVAGSGSGSDASRQNGPGVGGIGREGAGAGAGAGGMTEAAEREAERAAPLWRRCARCAAVMEDVYGTRPGFTFVLGQQRKCACGGHWALLPKGKLIS